MSEPNLGFDDQLAIPVAEVLRDVGIARALEAESAAWLDRAMRELRVFASLPEWRRFKTEDFRAWLLSRMESPHDSHVWGALTNRACREGVIRWTGIYVASVSPRTHAHPVKQWEAA